MLKVILSYYIFYDILITFMQKLPSMFNILHDASFLLRKVCNYCTIIAQKSGKSMLKFKKQVLFLPYIFRVFHEKYMLRMTSISGNRLEYRVG